jgi:hypothetical protein
MFNWGEEVKIKPEFLDNYKEILSKSTHKNKFKIITMKPDIFSEIACNFWERNPLGMECNSTIRFNYYEIERI